jgi:TOMM system kinase/cyclase fusion protein
MGAGSDREQESSEQERTINWDGSSSQSGEDPSQRTNDRSSDSSLAASDGKDQTEMPREFGRYRIDGELGKGGMGAVYLAHDTQLDRAVALKIPFFGKDDGPEIIERFYREARAMATLHHPNLCPIYDVGDIGGTHYLTMAYIDGQPLDKHISARRVFSSQMAAEVVRKLALALFEAHQKGIVHRDLKPANIMIDSRHEPVIMDFGLARREHEGEVHLTRAGAFLGTPAYMSPEQVEADQSRIGPASDIYSLGVVLYMMLTGQMPFDGSLARVMAKIIAEPPKPPSEINSAVDATVEAVCLKAMEKVIEDRYATAAEMAEALQAFLRTAPAESQDAEFAIDVTAAIERRPSTSIRSLSTLQRSSAGERRQVTVLYCGCDVIESEDEEGELDPEERQELLVEYKKACENIVSEFGGTVIPGAGEELTVCFGYPIAYEDAALRAVRAGLGIIAGLEALNKEFQRKNDVELSVWATVHTGLVVVGEADESSTTDGISIVGEARNVATRMESLADPETLIISDATHHLVDGYFECESKGKQRIRGLRTPIEIFRVLHESAAKTRLDVAAAELTPLIGRDREVGLLEDRWEEAEEGAGQVVLLVGEAGLGKSRLIHAIREHVAENFDSPDAIIEWRCSTYHTASGLHPATEYYQRALGIERDDDAAEKLDKLVQHVESCQLGDTNAAVALFASLLSIPLGDRFPALELTPQGQKEKTLELLLDWMRDQAANQPTLFIVEDLHWVDPSTVEFLGQLVEQAQNDSLLLVFTYRPEFEPPWGSHTHQTQIGLNRLRKKQIVEMVQVKTGLKEVPADIVEKVVDRTGGVPLFVEEFTKMVLETGGIKEVEGEVTVTEDFSLDKIPATLKDLLMARLDRMDANREVIQLGATLGREFSHELIEAVWPPDVGSLLEELDKLVEAEVLNRRGRPPKCTYQFKHALIQDAAYNSLLKKTRQEFHQAIAETLEQGFSDIVETEPEILARHFTEAGVAEQAIKYWLLAGQRSQQRSANDEAISQFRTGLELVAGLEESTDRDQQELGLLMSLGVVYMATLGWASNEVGDTFQRAREICEKLGARDHQFNIMWGTWGWRLLRAEYDACLELADDSTQLADDLQHPAILMEAPWIPGCTHFYRGNFSLALEGVTLGLSRWDREASLTTMLATGQNCGMSYQIYIGLSMWYLGFPDQALKWVQKAVELADDLKHPFSQGFALSHSSWMYALLRDGKSAKEHAERAFKIASEQSFPIWKFMSMINQGFGMHLLGDSEAGIELVEQGGGALLDVLGSKLNVPHFCHYAAQVHAKLGQYGQAIAHLDREQQHCEETNGKYTLAEVRRTRGEVLLGQSEANQAKAERCFREAISIAQQAEAKSWELRAATSLARLLQAQDKKDEARECLSTVFGWFTEGFETSDLVDARALLDELA